MNNQKVPKIRFKGFSGDWEQCKLGETFTLLQNNTLSRAELNEEKGVAKNVHYGDVLIKLSECLDLSKESLPFIEQQSVVDKFKNASLQNGDVVVADTAEDETVGKSTEIMGITDEKVISGLHTIPLRPIQQFSTGYLGYYFNSPSYHDQLKPHMQGIKVTSISKGAILGTVIKFPSDLKEQEQIGRFFLGLDHLITLHQSKLDKLKIIKKSMLENCFPKNGENVPKFRFSGFTGDWEQRKLGDIYTERNEPGNANLPILSVSIHSGVSDGELSEDDLGKNVRRSEDKTTYKHVYDGDLIFNMMRAWQGAIGVAKGEGMISPAYISAIPNDEVYPPFMDFLLKRADIINQINNLSYGVTDFRKRLYWDSFVRVKCMLPSVDEQKKIANTFIKLDRAIALHQSKLDKLKVIKKTLLESMFV